MILPHAVHQAPPGERVFRIGEPAREGGAAFAFGGVGRQCELRGRKRQGRQRAGFDRPARVRDLAAGQHVNGARAAAVRTGALERPAAGVDPAGIDEVGLGKGLQLRGDLGRLRPQLRASRPRGFVGRVQQQALELAFERLAVIRRERRGRDAVGEVGFLPAGCAFNAVRRGHGPAEGDVPAGAVGHAQLGQGKHVIVLPRREFRHGHAHVAADDAVVLAAAGRERRETGIREVRHERDVVAYPQQLDVAQERRVVAHLDLEAHRKAEAGADAVEVVVTGQQPDAIDVDRFAQVHLYPVRDVGRRRERAVVAEARAGFAGVRRVVEQRGVEPAVERGVGVAGPGAQGLLQAGERGGGFALLAFELLEARVAGVVAIVFAIRAVEGREHRLQPVVIFLRNRIELVLVTLGAVHGEARERADGVGHHVVAVEMTGELAVDFRLRHLGVADEVPRPGRDEPECLDAIGRFREEHVAGDLLLHEAGVRFVGIERADHVVAIRPGIGPELVLVVAVRVTVVHDVEPVPGPTFAVAG